MDVKKVHRKDNKMYSRDAKNTATCEPIDPQSTNTIVAETRIEFGAL